MPLNTSRRSCSRWGASSFISVRYGAMKSHSSSVTSLGYGFLAMQAVPQDHVESSQHALGGLGRRIRNDMGVNITAPSSMWMQRADDDFPMLWLTASTA